MFLIKLLRGIANWVLNNRQESLIIVAILGLAIILRFYRINEYMTFLGDEGRDVIVIKKILTMGDFPLLGPPTSVGNMYLGPLYYYMMVVAMAIFWLNPVAAAGMVAIIGVASVGLIYYLAREWFGWWPAVIASVLYAISPVNIIYSRSSWNPNPAPFFGLLAMLGMYKWHRSRDARWFILTGGAVAFAVQMHYLALILVGVFGVLWVYELGLSWRKKLETRHFWLGTIGGVLMFLILMSPLAIFDFRHDFMNYRAVSTFFLGDRATTVNLNIFNTLGRILPIYKDNLIGRYLSGDNPFLSWFLSLLVILPLGWVVFAKLKLAKKLSWPLLALGVWLVVGVMGLSLYKQTVYDHYLGFLNPVPFLLMGAFSALLLNLKGKWRKLAFGVVVMVGVIVAFQKSPLLTAPNNQLARTQAVAKYVINLSENRPFNFALIAEHNYDSAYQFYLDQYGHKPEQLPFVKTDQLLVVCEDPVCQPVVNAKYEIAAFGWTKIESQQDYQGVKIFKLIHNPEEDTNGQK